MRAGTVKLPVRQDFVVDRKLQIDWLSTKEETAWMCTNYPNTGEC
jgi:hypothetical protein